MAIKDDLAMTVKLAIHGAAGRMGQRVTALATADARFGGG